MLSEKISSLKDLEKVAENLISWFPNHRVFAFYGKMGAGKTTFIQRICKSLGTEDNVTSPTFALINEYKTPDFSSIFHFDFYRINSEEEAYNIGIEDYFHTDAWCLIEWPSVIKNLLPLITNNIYLTKLDDKQRNIQLK